MTVLQKVYIKNYGCQMNVYDGQKMADLLKPHGYCITESPDDADVAILNTCHIREKAEHKVFSDLGRLNVLKKDRIAAEARDMLIAVGGCVGQAEGAEITRQAPYVDMVFGPQSYHRLPEMLAQLEHKVKGKRRRIVNTEFPVESKFDFLPVPDETQVSAFLSIQEGCDKFCHFCVVPYTRGSEYSRPALQIIKEAKHLASIGAKEITLLGQNVNGYHGEGIDGKEWSLGRLLYDLAEIDGLKRIRYTTSHPLDMHDDLYNAHRDIDKLMPFLHLPVQSGSNKILNAMNRKHTADEYLKIIERLRNARSEIAFSSDFIVGYPGESDQDHKETIALVERVGFIQAYSFKYSPRTGTPASALLTQVPENVKSDRLAELQNSLNTLQLAFNETMVGKIVEVLFDRQGKAPQQIIGKTPYMQSVTLDGDCSLFGNFLMVKINNGYNNSLAGELI
ncbi:MAG: tRNA (N6-isopentenyl adenosine(37)-C2)-methylthiotransferase MiaB [Proteobacteria bacterium]|nr:tRNA (N6-isopentenyl adenosine(37)-C2)-methylthiotransferase MiaB [Pseudomonadota bacterium]